MFCYRQFTSQKWEPSSRKIVFGSRELDLESRDVELSSWSAIGTNANTIKPWTYDSLYRNCIIDQFMFRNDIDIIWQLQHSFRGLNFAEYEYFYLIFTNLRILNASTVSFFWETAASGERRRVNGDSLTNFWAHKSLKSEKHLQAAFTLTVRST